MMNLDWEGLAGARMNESATSRSKAHPVDYSNPHLGVFTEYAWQ